MGCHVSADPPSPGDPEAIGSAEQRAIPALEGQWTAPHPLPIDGLHAHVLPTGKVMYFGYSDGIYLWDPEDGSFQRGGVFSYNPFCAGHSFMPDGKLLITGGHNNANSWGLWNASIYDPFTGVMKMLPDMDKGRWYPSNITLPNGDVLVIAGQTNGPQDNDQLPIVWETKNEQWRYLTTAAQIKVTTYPHLHVAPNGKVFLSGPDLTTRYLDTAGTGVWSDTGACIDGVCVPTMKRGNRSYGTAVQYAPGKIMAMGGGAYGVAVPYSEAETIDLNVVPTPKWAYVSPMNYARQQHNAVILPDGKVLVIGGSGGSGFNNGNYPVFQPEIWDPATGVWSVMASNAVYRGYHSIGLLLPDGRVLSSSGVTHEDGEIFSPPYLFQAGERPTIDSMPAAVDYGSTFFVATPDAASVAQVSMLRLPSVTHVTNSDQRINFLPFVQAAGGIDVTAIANGNLGPPGYYYLFLLDANGVPSKGQIFRIGDGVGSNPIVPRPVTNLTAKALSPTSVKLGWRDNSNNEDGFTIEGSVPNGLWYQLGSASADATSYIETSVLAATTYHFRVRAKNPKGNSPYSDKVVVTTP